MDGSKNQLGVNFYPRPVESALFQSEPVVLRLAVVVHSNPVAINANASICIQIFLYHLTVNIPKSENLCIAIENEAFKNNPTDLMSCEVYWRRLFVVLTF